ncbi:MAG TPA: hypothetical protein VFJ58_05260 [Armatimonadota bacterium]|nr:hypothetical protein [Armatimonadota bacterium]
MNTDPASDSNSDQIPFGAETPDADQWRIEGARQEYQRAISRVAALRGLRDIALEHRGAGRQFLACGLYSAVLKSALAHFGEVDDGGEAAQLTADFGAQLVGCLAEDLTLASAERMSPADRLQPLHLLYNLWWFDMASGGLAAAPGMESELFRGATANERNLIAQWLWRDRRFPSNLPRLWLVFSREYFRAMLETGEEPDDEILLNKYRANRLHDAAAGLLIDMDRPEEALIEGGQSPSVAVRIRVADALLECGEEWVEPALGLVEDRLTQAEKSQEEAAAIDCLRWITRRCREIGQIDRALGASRRWFQIQPGYSTYLRVRSLGETWLATPKWRDLRDSMLSLLKEKRDWDTIIRILLNEGEIREARRQLASIVERDDPERAASLRQS